MPGTRRPDSILFLLVLAVLACSAAWNADLLPASLLGAGATVEPNPYNTAARALAEKEQELAERETAVAESEQRLASERRLQTGATIALGTLIVVVGLWAGRRVSP